MADFVVIVDFRLRRGLRESFRALIDANARSSIDEEPGCRRFDVIEPAGDPDRILLYEIYDSRAAFDAHLATPHFLAFDRDGSAMIESRIVTTGELVCEASLGSPGEHQGEA
jgi:(4S)-4-hydroxy-5-phosphonooxypentane-2,3-dione isomerase